MSRENYSDNNLPPWLIIIIFILCIFIMNISNDNSIDNSRREQNMIPIEEGFAYDAETRIIYREYISGRSKYSYDKTSYSPYITENGNFVRYLKGEWVEMEGEDNY